ncbi:MAG: zinc ribbon domain-containing protein [Clostridia bacterium]|nr:zinc ribbon domain-containing protein [Clostridia bacterium]
MFCKNCGKEIESENAICTGCGFRGNNGNKFCSHCGKEVLPGQAMCVNCGFMLCDDLETAEKSDVVEKKEQTVKPYTKYTSTVKKINVLNIILHSCAICLVLCMLFLPIYKCKYEPTIEEIENFEQLEDALEDGYIEKNFTLVEDIVITFKSLFSESSKEFYGLGGVWQIATGMFALFEFVFGVTLIVMSSISIFKTANMLMDEEGSTMLTYNSMLKTGERDKKQGFFQKQSIFGIVLYLIFDIIYAKLFGGMFANMGGEETTMQYRNMINFSSFSGFIAIMLVVFTGYIVISVLKKAETKKMLLDITSAQYDK